tara:strand:+ start:2230 stop:2631 length:402 start_codon:yes stop_codon:yes gene_type:complete
MPLTDKGKKIMKSMQKQYGKKKGEQVFYASVNEGKITGVEKKEMKKASLGLLAAKKAKDKGAKGAEFLSPLALAMRLIGRKKGSPKKGERMSQKLDTAEAISEQNLFGNKKNKPKKLKGGGAAIRGTNFKGVF